MSENNKHPSAGRGRKRAGWFRRLFFGGSKTLADDMLETDRYGQQKIEDVEVILSPGKQIVKGFFEKKYAVVALVVVVVMFLIAFVGPLFMPKYFDAYSENTQQSIYPTLSMMKMPKELQKDVKQVSSYGPFTVGLSGSGKVYVWGCTQIGTTGFDVSRIPEDVQKANIVMVAAGIDHIIAIDDKGKIYGWGNYKLGQYGRYDEFADTSFVLPIPQELYDNGVDVSKVKKLTCGYQSTAILMEDGTLYVWGNKNAYSNMEFFATLNEVDETLDFVPEQTLLKDIAFTMNYIIGVRMPPADCTSRSCSVRQCWSPLNSPVPTSPASAPRSSPRSASTGRTARTPPSSASLRPRPPSPTSFRTIPSCSAALSRIRSAPMSRRPSWRRANTLSS